MESPVNCRAFCFSIIFYPFGKNTDKVKKIDIPAEKIFFTSDMHFGHEGIIIFANRPFDSAEKMDQTLIRNWNQTVPEDGLTFVLGDIGNTDKKPVMEKLNKLNGQKILIRGNHDHIYKEEALRTVFEEIHDLLYIRIFANRASRYQYIALCHYPMLDWQNSFRGAWQLFGHLHTREIIEFEYFKTRLFPKQYDVGVDNNDFRPVSFYTIEKLISEQKNDRRFKRTNYSCDYGK